MEALLVKYGYLLLFVGVAIEGEAFLLGGAYLAHAGYLSLTYVIAVAVAANCAADQVYYVAARARGRRWLDQRFAANPHYDRTMRVISRHQDWLLLVSRFAFGFRVIIPAACGSAGMSPVRFAVINFVAGAVWAVPTALLGFYFADAAGKVIEGIKLYELQVIGLFLVAAALVLVTRHIRRSAWVEDLRLTDIHGIIPYLTGFMGVLNLASAIWPRSQSTLAAIEAWLPLEVTQSSRALMLLAGLALIQVSRNLSRHKELAWYVTVLALATSILLHITRGLDLHHSLVAGLLLTYLIAYRRRFNARSDPASLRRALILGTVLFSIVYVYAYVGLNGLRQEYLWHGNAGPAAEAWRSGILILEPNLDPVTPHAARFLGSVQISGWLARFYVLFLLLRPVILRRRADAPREAVDTIFRSHGRKSLSAFAVQPDKHHLLTSTGKGLVAFATRGSVAIACGDPLVAEDDYKSSVEDYLAHCRGNGWVPCLYDAAEEHLHVYQALGMRTVKIAEEALIDLTEFNLAGGKRANLRAMVNKMNKLGMTVQRYDREKRIDPSIDEQLEAISEEWLAEKALAELGFTMGRFSLETLRGIPVFAAMQGQRIQAFCSWLPYRNGEGAVLDLMRKRKQTASGTMDYLLAQSLFQLKDAGVLEASLANAPLASVSERRDPLDKGVGILFENLNSFYGYKNLFQFKKKFAPRWEGRYLVYPRGADLPRVALALTRLHSSGGWLRVLAGI